MKTIEQTYQKKSQLEHVLHRPGMYIGDIDKISSERWVIINDKMVRKVLQYNPGLYKIFDEVFTNALDQSQRDTTLKKIEVNIDKQTGEISVYNDGVGIPIEIHKDLNKYVPYIIFGEFHTSSNYDDTEKRTVGGLNGYGAKLTNVFSKMFKIEVADGSKMYSQIWKNNMSICEEPVIKASKKSYVRITFIPDYSRFGLTFNEDIYSLIKTRVYDGSAISSSKVGVYFDNEKVSIKDFETYMNMFVGTKSECPRVYEKLNGRWEVGIALNQSDKFSQVSFVNGISTSDGGTHVDYIVNQIIYRLKDQIEKKIKILS